MKLTREEKVRLFIRLIKDRKMSIHRAARTSGLAYTTARRLLKRVKKCRLTHETALTMSDSELIALLYPKRNKGSVKVMPDFAEIHRLMQQKHQTRIQLWDEYKALFKERAYGYSHFNDLYLKFRKSLDLTMRQSHPGGEVCFVDFAGTRPFYIDHNTGEKHHVEIFVAVMGCSNYTFAYAVPTQGKEDFVKCLVETMKFYGAVPNVVCPDNLRSAITKPGRHFVVQKDTQACAEHYDYAIVPSRVRKPQDKSKAEYGVLLVTRWITVPLRRQTYFSITEMNKDIQLLLTRLNDRPFRRLPGCRRSRFEEMDKPLMRPLPEVHYEFQEFITAQKVGPDYHVYVHNHAYSVPYSYAHKRVEARVTRNLVTLYYDHQAIASHVRSNQRGEHTTDPAHRPPKHQAYAEQNQSNFKAWANKIGPSTLAVVTSQFDQNQNYSMRGRRACDSLQKLAKQYGNDRLEMACERAIEIHSMTVKSIRSMLCHGLEAVDRDSESVQAPLLHTNIRGKAYYSQEGQP